MEVDFEYDGEMSVKVALDSNLRKLYKFCRLYPVLLMSVLCLV